MARAINVIMEIENGQKEKQEFSVNNDGLVNMTFDRFLGNPDSTETEFLSNVDLSMFDKSGYKLLSIIQGNKGKLRFKYGFEDDMSDIFELNITKLNSTYNNLGCMVSIGAVGSQVTDKFPAALYDRGTSVESILINMALRNGWSIGKKYKENGIERYTNIDCRLELPWSVWKESDESDYDFIFNKILPLANASVTNPDSSYDGEFWDARLYDKSANLVFYFQPYVNTEKGTRQEDLRIWKYTYGSSTKSKVIRVTNRINYNFLIKGLTIKVPALLLETLDEGKVTQEYLENLIFDKKWPTIKKSLEEYGLPVPTKDEFKFTADIIPIEESDFESLESIEKRVINAVKTAIMSLNSIELVVEGNPRILPTDLVELEVMNRTDKNTRHWNIISGFWKVVKIREEVGMSGFTTTLSLVRNNIDMETVESENTNQDYGTDVPVKSTHITRGTGGELSYNNPELPDGWYTLTISSESEPGPVLLDLTSSTVLYKNRYAQEVITGDDRKSHKNYSYSSTTLSMDIKVVNGYFKIYSAGANIFDDSRLTPDYITLSKTEG